jgi:hypothetical protein
MNCTIMHGSTNSKKKKSSVSYACITLTLHHKGADTSTFAQSASLELQPLHTDVGSPGNSLTVFRFDVTTIPDIKRLNFHH